MIATRCLIIFVLCRPIVQNGNCDGVLESLYGASANSTKNVSNDGGTTTETHYTTCKITTEQLVADARATFTRVLTGACNAKMIEERFEKLERSFNERFDEIRKLIVRPMTRQEFDFSETNDDEDEKSEIRLFDGTNRLKGIVVDTDENEFDNESERIPLPTLRQDEVERYNNSVHVDERQSNVYTYYWRVSNLVGKLLEWDTGRSERSSSFYVGDTGYAMYLRFTPKYFPDGTIFISVGLTAGHNDSKIIWPFPLQIRIEILDLVTVVSANDKPRDRSSRLWDPSTVCSSFFWGRPRRRMAGGSSDNPECVGLSIPRQLLTTVVVKQKNPSSSSSSSLSTGNYLANNSLLVKLTVYL